jgi:hypothetical protein
MPQSACSRPTLFVCLHGCRAILPTSARPLRAIVTGDKRDADWATGSARGLSPHTPEPFPSLNPHRDLLRAYCKSPYRDRPGQANLTIPKISLPGRSRYSPKDFATGTQTLIDVDIWRLELNGDRSVKTPPLKLIFSTRVDHDPQYSPEGSWIAFRLESLRKP